MKKNDLIELEITDLALSGSGVGHHEGMAIFVPGTAVGDVIQAHILKVKRNLAFAKANKILKASPDRIDVDCPVFSRCGGCVFRHISYSAELRLKENQVRENLHRIGKLDIEPEPITGSEKSEGYRNKAQYPISSTGGRIHIGFYAPRSHTVIDCRRCALQPDEFSGIVGTFSRWIERFNVSVYNEADGSGLLRHIFLRKAQATGEIAVCAVSKSDSLPHTQELVTALLEEQPKIKSIVLNINPDDTNVILGKACRTLWGSDYITDVLCSLKIRISPLSFYQVNREQAERLYRKAAEYAELDGTQTVLDLYCGTGTIGLSMADKAKKIIGVEIVPQAVEDAKQNAEINGIRNAEFICADVTDAARQLKSEGSTPSIVLLDPPRKGCDNETLNAVAEMSPQKIVYISCDSATLARDCAILTEYGYQIKKATPFDLFPRTGHVETVVLMSRKDK